MVLRWPGDKDFPLPATKALQFSFSRGHDQRDAGQRPTTGSRRSGCGVGVRRWDLEKQRSIGGSGCGSNLAHSYSYRRQTDQTSAQPEWDPKYAGGALLL